LLRKIKFKSTI